MSIPFSRSTRKLSKCALALFLNAGLVFSVSACELPFGREVKVSDGIVKAYACAADEYGDFEKALTAEDISGDNHCRAKIASLLFNGQELGAYRVGSANKGVALNLVPNPDYKGAEKPRNKGVSFIFYPDAKGDAAKEDANLRDAYASVQRGDLDVLDIVPVSQLKNFRSDENVLPHVTMTTVPLNLVVPTYLEHLKSDDEGNLRRQAILAAIDSEKLYQEVYFSKPSDQFLIKKATADIKTAQELWKQANEKAKWDEPKFTITPASDLEKVAATIIAKQLKSVLNLDVEVGDVEEPQKVKDMAFEKKTAGGFFNLLDLPSVEIWKEQLRAVTSLRTQWYEANLDGIPDYKKITVDKVIPQKK